MDGAAGLTQCPIPPGKSFTYRIPISEDESGTFWFVDIQMDHSPLFGRETSNRRRYHAHQAVARGDGLYGGLIVHRPVGRLSLRDRDWRSTDVSRYGYEKELLLLVGDWYHRKSEDVLAWYMNSASFGNEV